MPNRDDEDEQGTGLRELKKQQTRNALSWATIRLAVERGLGNVRVEDIAAEAGVSPRTFNNYFSSKGEAIAARQVERVHRIAEALRARPVAEPLWDAVTAAVLAQFALGEGDGGRSTPDPGWISGVRRMVADPDLQSHLLRVDPAAHDELATAVADRTATDVEHDLYPQLVAGAVATALQAAMRRWLGSEPPGPVEPLLREALDRIRAGLPAP